MHNSQSKYVEPPTEVFDLTKLTRNGLMPSDEQLTEYQNNVPWILTIRFHDGLAKIRSGYENLIIAKFRKIIPPPVIFN